MSPGRIATTPGVPPVVLFHGTAAGSAPAILAEGLRPMQRQYVHLSVDQDTAYTVGRRKSTVVSILVVHASEAYQRGVRFWLGNQMVWLADYIPPAFISADSGG